MCCNAQEDLLLHSLGVLLHILGVEVEITCGRVVICDDEGLERSSCWAFIYSKLTTKPFFNF